MSNPDSGAEEGPLEDVPRRIQEWPEREVERYVQYKSVLRQIKGNHPQRRLYETKLKTLTQICEANASFVEQT